MPERMGWLDDKKEEIIKLYYKYNMDYIAEYFNVSRSSISRRLFRWEITEQQKRVYINKDILYDLYHNQKLSEPKIADIYGCNRSAIHRRMVRFGIKRRTHNECTEGELNPFYNKKHTENARRKMSLSFTDGKRLITGSNQWGTGAYYNTPNQGRKWMRSGWERKAANYLTMAGINWYYEYKWLKIDNYGYLPDFFIPEDDRYIEVKGVKIQKYMERLEIFMKHYNIELWDRNELLKRNIINKSGV